MRMSDWSADVCSSDLIGTDLIFGWNHRDRIIDFGYRAVHESVVAAKAVTAAFYGEPAKWSYFSGCSTGGYQGLSEAQRYPDDFDGIISCAPGNNRTNLTLAFLDRKSTRLNPSHSCAYRMPSSA